MKDRNRNIGLVGWIASLLITILVCSTIFAPVVYPPDLWLEDLHAGQRYTMKSDGTNYWAVRFDGKIFHETTNATQTVEWSLDNSSDWDTLNFAEGVWDIASAGKAITDQGKNGITIKGTHGTIFDIDSDSNDIDGFWLTSVDDWIFDGVQFYAGDVKLDGQAGHENFAIGWRDCNRHEVKNVLFKELNGYCLRVDSDAGSPSYVTGLDVHDNTALDYGHNFFSGAGVNDSIFDNNWLWKSGGEFDEEHFWFGYRSAGNLGCYRNTVQWNQIFNGSIAYNCGSETSTGYFEDNKFMFNTVRKTFNTSATNGESLVYIPANRTTVYGNTLIDLDPTKAEGQSVIKIPSTAIDHYVDMTISKNVIVHLVEGGIILSDDLHSSDISENQIRGTPSGEYSLSIPTLSYCTVVRNIGDDTFNIGANANGNTTLNIEDAPW